MNAIKAKQATITRKDARKVKRNGLSGVGRHNPRMCRKNHCHACRTLRSQ